MGDFHGMASSDASPAVHVLADLVRAVGPDGAKAALVGILDGLTTVELAGLWADWEFWSRVKQHAPEGEWLTWGFLTGRGWGKTQAAAKFIVGEVERGEVRTIGMAAQNEDKTYDVNVAGLIDASPPRFVPTWLDGEGKLVWPNGAVAYAYTPEAPGNVRSKNLDLAWLSELQSWPAATREETYLNFKFATRVGRARMVWDATPKRGHPILKRLLQASERFPDLHPVVRGTMQENRINLARAAIAALEDEFAGTTAGREELGGEMLDEDESATVSQAVIDANRRPAPSRFVRRVIAVDPSGTARKGSDPTGIADVGLGADGVAYVLASHHARQTVDEWPAVALDLYLLGRADLMILETNYGGDTIERMVRAEAGPRGMSVVKVAKGAPVPPHNPRVVYVREVYSRGEKSERARPVGTSYERGRVSHVIGADLTKLEETLTTWVPGPHSHSPGDLDSLVFAVVELLGLADDKPAPAREDMRGYSAAQAMLTSQTPGRPMTPTQQQTKRPSPMAALARGLGGGGVIR